MINVATRNDEEPVVQCRMAHSRPVQGPRAAFLTAEWRHLVMLNYEVDAALLQPFVPKGTELDQWQGRTFVSMVGFLFLKAKVLGLTVPFHSAFEEVNLRFYVKRNEGGEVRRGVVFLKELVPRRGVAWTARFFYNENYIAVPMGHDAEIGKGDAASTVSYRWVYKHRQNRLGLVTQGGFALPEKGSQEEFITEHYWGYARQPKGGTVEYLVEHVPWQVAMARSIEFECDVERLYGKEFAPYLEKPPVSGFLVNGSPVTVYKGRHLH